MNGHRLCRGALLALLLCTTGAANAAERRLGLGSFDTIRLEGPYQVEIRTGRSPSALISGDRQAVDAVTIDTNGAALAVRRNTSAWGGDPGAAPGRASVILTTPSLSQIGVTGAGSVTVDRITGAKLRLLLAGGGQITISSIEVDDLAADLTGAGTIALSGTAKTARFGVQGPGTIDSPLFAADHLAVTAAGSATVRAGAQTTAKVTAGGTGMIRIASKGDCTVDNRGSGIVECGPGVQFVVAAPDGGTDNSAIAADATGKPAGGAAPRKGPARKKPAAGGVSRHPSGVRIHRGEVPSGR